MSIDEGLLDLSTYPDDSLLNLVSSPPLKSKRGAGAPPAAAAAPSAAAPVSLIDAFGEELGSSLIYDGEDLSKLK